MSAIENTGVYFDPSKYYAHKPVLQLIPGLALGRAYEQADKFGPKYWGVNRGSLVAPIADDIHNRLIQFQKVLKAVPDLDPVTFEWADGQANNIAVEGKKNLKQSIVLQRSIPKGKNSRPQISITYDEALQDPDIMYSAFGTLLEDRDPVAEGIEALEVWRLKQEEENAPDSKYLRLGIEAYKIGLLGIRREQAQSVIGGIAMSKHKIVLE